MAELHLWRRRTVGGGALVLPGNWPEQTLAPRLVEYRKVAFGDSRPCHAPAMRIRAFAHCSTAGIVGEQIRYFAADGVGIAERHEHSPTLRQQLLRVPIRSRDHRFPQAKTVGQS